MNPPSNWSQVQVRTKDKASLSCLEEITRSVIAVKACETQIGLLEHARHPSRGDWEPTSPPNIRGAPKGASLTSSAPFSSPEATGRRASSIVIGRVREPMCFWDTEWQQRSDHDPR